MNFTREPIVETIISAKEGYKLSIKSSKQQAQEEHLVDAVEMVSFSGALFYRSQEKPKSFFLPIQDYEIQEVREARLTVKSPVMEKSIKIGGGKEAGKQHHKVEQEEKPAEIVEEGVVALAQEKVSEKESGREHKREKRQKYKRKRGFEDQSKEVRQQNVEGAPVQITPIPESVFSHLLKPPESLISDSIHKYKKIEDEVPHSPEVVHDLQASKQEEATFFSESPAVSFEEEIIDRESLIFIPEDVDKPQE